MLRLFPSTLPVILAASAALSLADAPPPVPAARRPAPAAEAWQVIMSSEPNSRGVRGVLLALDGRGRGFAYGLQQPDGTVLPARGAMDNVVVPQFMPTQLCWVTDTCLMAFAPSASGMQPHDERVSIDPQGETSSYFPEYSRLSLIELPGTLKGPTAKSRNLPGYNYWLHTRLELPPGLQVQVEDGVLRLLDAGGKTAFCFDCNRQPVEPRPAFRPKPDYKGGVPQATKAMKKAGYGDEWQVPAAFPANGRGERLVAIIPADPIERRGFYEFALLTPEGALHPLGTPDMKNRAQGKDFFTPGTFVWLDEDTFCLYTSSGAGVWRLAADRQPQASPHDTLPRVGVTCLFRGLFGPGRHLRPEADRLRILFGKTEESAEQVGEIVWDAEKR